MIQEQIVHIFHGKYLRFSPTEWYQWDEHEWVAIIVYDFIEKAFQKELNDKNRVSSNEAHSGS